MVLNLKLLVFLRLLLPRQSLRYTHIWFLCTFLTFVCIFVHLYMCICVHFLTFVCIFVYFKYKLAHMISYLFTHTFSHLLSPKSSYDLMWFHMGFHVIKCVKFMWFNSWNSCDFMSEITWEIICDHLRLFQPGRKLAKIRILLLRDCQEKIQMDFLERSRLTNFGITIPTTRIGSSASYLF